MECRRISYPAALETMPSPLNWSLVGVEMAYLGSYNERRGGVRVRVSVGARTRVRVTVSVGLVLASGLELVLGQWFGSGFESISAMHDSTSTAALSPIIPAEEYHRGL